VRGIAVRGAGYSAAGGARQADSEAMVAPNHAGFGAQAPVEDSRVTALKRKLDTLQYRDAFDTTSLPLVEKVRAVDGWFPAPVQWGQGATRWFMHRRR
jgi:hypothetical protein